MNAEITHIRTVKRRHEGYWLSISGVAAVGIGQVGAGKGIIVTVWRLPDEIRMLIPAVVEGVPVEIRPAGAVIAMDNPDSRQQ